MVQPLLEPVPFTDVTIRDRFWTPRQEVNRSVTVDHCLNMLEEAGNFHNLRLAAEGKHEGYKGPVYIDSDLYKTMEGIAYTLATHPDPHLDSRLDEIIDLLASAQMPDGYLNTWHQVNKPDERWTNLRDRHELYCAGHLIEAAVAHNKATGKGSLLAVALKFCEHIWLMFGPDARAAYPGHPEIELALVKLWKLTGDQRWFDLAKRFLDNRGNGYFAREHGQTMEEYRGAYWVDNLRVDQHLKGVGHAVRFAYLMCGASDVARVAHDGSLERMLRKTWDHIIQRQMYITGGVGSDPKTEGFADDFELPNATGYQETCASIAMAMWGRRTGDYDVVETALYNAVLGGVGLDGKSFFYDNPLENDGSHRRQPWFECACCPPNILRTLACLGDYIYETDDKGVYVNLYVGGTLRTEVCGEEFVMDAESDLFGSGKITYTIRSDRDLQIVFRRPKWCTDMVVRSEGATSDGAGTEEIRRRVCRKHWKPGDQIEVHFSFQPQAVQGNPQVADQIGKAAVRWGPVICCAEQADNENPVEEMKLSPEAKLRGEVVEGPIPFRVADGSIHLIPYAFWANREPGPMRVWIPM